MDKVKSIIDIKLIPDTIGEAGIEKDFRVEPGVMTEILADKDLQVTEPFQIHYEVLRHQENIHVRVDIKGVIRTTCSRCLCPMTHTVDLHLDSDYMPAPPEMEDEHMEAERAERGYGLFPQGDKAWRVYHFRACIVFALHLHLFRELQGPVSAVWCKPQ